MIITNEFKSKDRVKPDPVFYVVYAAFSYLKLEYTDV